jgi:hypothetical protein
MNIHMFQKFWWTRQKAAPEKPSHPGMGGSAETPTSHSAGGQSQGTEESNVASGGGLWVIWLDDELDSHCWSWEAKDCWKKHVNPVAIDWDDGSWPNLVRM